MNRPLNRPRPWSIAAAAVGLVAVLCGVAGAEVPATEVPATEQPTTVQPATVQPATDHRFFLRLSPGAAYLHESWSPSGSSAGARFTGTGPSLELSIGKSVRPRLVVGGLWQLVYVSDPAESYLGTTTVVPGTFRFFDLVSAFADYTPNPRRGIRIGGSAGLLAASNADRECCLATHWGVALGVRVGYDLFFSRRWSAGALAQLEAYRYSSSESDVSSVSYGLLPTLALALTFDWGRGRSTGTGERHPG